MVRLKAAILLLMRLFIAMFLSAWTTSRTILLDSSAGHRGCVRFHYGDLNERGVILLAAIITLTPGTSTLDIDRTSHELLLHVLDTRDLDEALGELRTKFLTPARVLFGVAKS
jgi:multisubunit Na+/H+ antiporter MnhE subunit